MFEYLCILCNAILLIFCLVLSREVRELRSRLTSTDKTVDKFIDKTYKLDSCVKELTKEREEADEKEAKLFEGIKNIFDYNVGVAQKAVKAYGEED